MDLQDTQPIDVERIVEAVEQIEREERRAALNALREENSKRHETNADPYEGAALYVISMLVSHGHLKREALTLGYDEGYEGVSMMTRHLVKILRDADDLFGFWGL